MEKVQEALKADKELQKKLEDEIRRLAGAGEASSDGELIAKALQAVLGVEIPLSEIEKAYAQSQKLSDEDLDKVAGGEDWDKDYYDDWCTFDYCCYTAFYHSEYAKGDQNACWSDYTCVFFNH